MARAVGTHPHVGYGWVALSLLALGGAILGVLPAANAVHVLTTGAVGAMTLAVMTRASLGHTGRPRHAGLMTVVIYVLVNLGAVLRVFAPAPDAPTASDASPARHGGVRLERRLSPLRPGLWTDPRSSQPRGLKVDGAFLLKRCISQRPIENRAIYQCEHRPATIAFVRSGDGETLSRPSRHQIGCRNLHDIAGVIHQKDDFLPRL